MKHTLKQMTIALLVAGASLLPIQAAVPSAQSGEERMAKSIRRELLTMPFLSIFDNLSYRIDGGTVHLYGQVIRPTLKSMAAKRVSMLEGVSRVEDHIEVLPVSSYDDRLRLGLARAIYGQSALNRYAMVPNPPIRIIVKNGNVTLEGLVNNEMDRNIANIRANGVFGTFSVTNNLRVERSRG